MKSGRRRWIESCRAPYILDTNPGRVGDRMSLPELYFDWRNLGTSAAPTVVDSRWRLRVALALFVALLVIVFARIVALEWSYGDARRAEAERPLERREPLPALRGRILARDGTVLAYD